MYNTSLGPQNLCIRHHFIIMSLYPKLPLVNLTSYSSMSRYNSKYGCFFINLLPPNFLEKSFKGKQQFIQNMAFAINQRFI